MDRAENKRDRMYDSSDACAALQRTVMEMKYLFIWYLFDCNNFKTELLAHDKEGSKFLTE